MHKKLIFGVFIAIIFTLPGCSKKTVEIDNSAEYGSIHTEAAAEAETEEYSPLLPVHVERDVEKLPEKEEGDFSVNDDHLLIQIPGSRVIAAYPKTAEAVVKDEYNAIIKIDSSSWYYIHRFYNNNFTDTLNISKYSADAIKSLHFKSDGNPYTVSRYDAGNTISVIDPVGEIINELPSLTMIGHGGKLITPSMAVSYRFVDEDAYMVAGISLTETPEELNNGTYDIIRSIRPYTPAAASAEVNCIKPVTITDTVTVNVPDGWEISSDNGFIICTPADSSSIYTGMEIYIYNDERMDYCLESLGLATGIEAPYIKHRYSTDQNYNYDTDIIDFDEVSEGGLDGYFFEIRNNIYPGSRQAVTDLPSCGTHINSFAYTFADPNGIPFIIGVSYADKNKDQAFTLCKKTAETVTTVNSK